MFGDNPDGVGADMASYQSVIFLYQPKGTRSLSTYNDLNAADSSQNTDKRKDQVVQSGYTLTKVSG